MTTSTAFTISELNAMLRDVVTSGFPRAVWVCGEVQGYDRNKGRAHAFFELVEKSTDAVEVKARMGLVIWANTRPRIDAVLTRAENAFALKDDIEVKFLCKVDFYTGFGQVRLVVEDIDPVYTLGKMAQDRQKLVAELMRSGILEKNKQQAMPAVPLRIGLVTAFDSAAHNDFRDELQRSGCGFRIYLARAVMQGKNCAPSVVAALAALNARDDLDVIVVTRGGGSIAELACFDSKDIALAIAASKYPVITGIGHEINTSIADLAAHTCTKTPTAAAQLLAGAVMAFLRGLDECWRRLGVSALEAVNGRRVCLKDAAIDLRALLPRWLKGHREQNVLFVERLKRAPLNAAADARTGLQRSGEGLRKTIRLRLTASVIKIDNYQKLAGMVSPQNILKRGFSITRAMDGRAIRSARDVSAGQALRSELADGFIESTAVGGPELMEKHDG